MKSILSQIKSIKNLDTMVEGQTFTIVINKQQETKTEKTPVEKVTSKKQYNITVKKYMTKKGTPQFDFMTKWNNDVPMPLVTMTGTIEKETRGMYFMKLHGVAQNTVSSGRVNCLCCGKPLTNPISKYYGLGPECGSHFYINPFKNEEELYENLDKVKETISNITWEGWVIKSAILESEEVKGE